MRPVAVSKKLSKFDPKTFLSTINGGRKIEAFPKKEDDLCAGRLRRCCFLYKGRKGKTHRCVEDGEGEGGHNRHSEQGRFLRRRLPYRAASPPVLRNRDDRLLRDANR